MKLSAAHISIQKARWIGPVQRMRGRDWVLVGQDGAQSIRCGDSVLFFFSDTLLVLTGGDVPEQYQPTPPLLGAPEGMQTVFLANCAGLSEHSDIERALATIRYFPQNDGLPREILSPDARERFRKLRFWPEHGVCIDGRVYFYYLGIQTINPDSIWGFRVLGTGLAVLDPHTGLCERAKYRGDWIFWRNKADDLHYGVQVLAVEDWVYVFGSSRSGLETQAVLARVGPAHVLDGDAYQYLSSAEPAWTSDPGGAALLGPASSEYSVGYNEYLGKYTLFYLDGYSKTLNLRVADRVWGPYSEPMPLFRIPAKSSSELIYLGFEHEAFRRDGGRSVFISCCEPYFSLPSLLTITFERNGQTLCGHLDAE
jgi:Domain of unknown function (DUF4185)